MYTETCPELDEAMAATSSAPYIQFNLILCFLLTKSISNDDREWQPRLNGHRYLQLIDGTKQGKDDYRTCTRGNSPQTAVVGVNS
jgi:hypothetical protein